MEDDFGIDVEVDLDDVGTPAPVSQTLHVFDPAGQRESAEALRSLGFDAQTVQLGSALMASAQAGKVSAVVIAHDADVELRELFMRAFRARFGDVPVLYLSARLGDPAEVRTLQDEGATGILGWPIADREQAIAYVRQVFPHLIDQPQGQKPPEQEEAGFDVPPTTVTPPPIAPGPITPGAPAPLVPPVAPKWDDATKEIPVPAAGEVLVPAQEADVLVRKVASLEVEGPPSVVSRSEFEAAVKQVAERDQSTELRSELTLVRDRNQLLEERLKRLTREVQALTKERDELLSGRAGGGFDEVSDEFRSLMRGSESYTWALETTIQFIEDLKSKVGSRAPSLDTHLRTLRLVKDLIERLGEEAQKRR